MYLNFLEDKFAVIGVGETGISIINYLNYVNANVVNVFDTRENPPKSEFWSKYNVIGGKLDYNLLKNANIIVISPGVSIYEEALQLAIHNGIKVIGDIELFALAIKNWGALTIGITGSNGKTTVTTLTGYLASILGLNTLVAGNIGFPVLNSYLEIVKNNNIPEVIVLELSSFQLETTYSLSFAAATVLNISEDHLDRYRDVLEYAYTKANIFNNCKVQVLNHDDTIVRAMFRHSQQYKLFGANSNVEFALKDEDNKTYLQIRGQNIVDCDQLKIMGRHNYLNILASLALLDGLSIKPFNIFDKKVIDALYSFGGLEHRMQVVLKHDGITFIEDSKGTNVGAVVAGVGGLNGLVHLILGGDGKGQDFAPLCDLVEKKCKSVAVIGQDKLKILEVLKDVKLPIKNCETLEDAVLFCYKNAIKGENVVLSPACASWDMFDNYKHRAEVFIKYVHTLITAKPS